MTSILASLVVFLVLAFMTYAGVRDGVFFTTYALMRNLIGFLLAMTFHEPLAGLLSHLISGTHPAPGFFVVISFGGILGGVFMFGRWLKIRYTAPRVECSRIVDRVAGPVVGLVSGIVVTGALLILWSLFPFVKYVPRDLGYVKSKIDTGTAMLRFYSFSERKMGGGKVFLLEDEALDPEHPDRDGNGRPNLDGEGYLDANRNDKWDRGWLWRYRNHGNIGLDDLEPLGVLEESDAE